MADIRVKAADPSTSLVSEIKALEADGQVSLLVEDADFQGQPAVLVILDQSGAVRAQATTIVGRLEHEPGYPRPVGRRGLRWLHRSQGPGAQVPRPVSRAHLRRRVPHRPLLRHHRRGRDRGGAGDRRAPDARAYRAPWRGGAVQVPRARARPCQADRPHHRAPGHQHRLLSRHPAQPCGWPTCASIRNK